MGSSPSLIRRQLLVAMAALTFVGSPLGPNPGTADARVLASGRHAPWKAVATKTAWKPCSTTGGGGGVKEVASPKVKEAKVVSYT